LNPPEETRDYAIAPPARRSTRADRRAEFILRSLEPLRWASGVAGAGLFVIDGTARDVLPRLAAELEVDAVFASRNLTAVLEGIMQRRVVIGGASRAGTRPGHARNSGRSGRFGRAGAWWPRLFPGQEKVIQLSP